MCYDSVSEVTVRSRINEIQEDWKPTFLTNEEFTHLVLEAVDGFIMVFSASGHIYYASESIASLLGHLPVSNLVLQNIHHKCLVIFGPFWNSLSSNSIITNTIQRTMDNIMHNKNSFLFVF